MEKDNLKALGSKAKFKFEYDKTLLESFNNKFENDYFIKFNCPEFTSICPITGQPDFAAIYINYIADKRCVESKSLKLYLGSFRNHGEFHETCVNTIMRDLIELLDPRYIEVLGEFMPRGGISIDPFANYGKGEKYERMAEYRLFNHDIEIKKIDNR